MQAQVKIVGSNGQISLGKEFAGKMVLIDNINESTWIIKTGNFIPDSEQWLHAPEVSKKLDQALAWAEKHEPKDNFEKFSKGL